MMRRAAGLGAVAALAFATQALAHVERVAPVARVAPAAAARAIPAPWTWDATIVVPLVVLAVAYACGAVPRTRGRAAVGAGEVTAFAAGWLALVFALLSPVHALGERLFSVHMIQHELLMLVAAPLLVLGRPHVAILRAMPRDAARALVTSPFARAFDAPWRILALPLVAWAVHAVTLWAWHAPPLFEAALAHEWVHALQHTTFLGSALLFWWATLERAPRRAMSYGAAVLFLFTTALHSGLLGALLTFAETPWYPTYVRTAVQWGTSPLADQQLGGAIMWAPACGLYTIAGLALFVAWMRGSARRIRVAESQWAIDSGEPR